MRFYRFAVAAVLLLALADTAEAQSPGQTWARCARELKIDSVSSSHVHYTVLRAPCAPLTVGRSYKLQIGSFQSEYVMLYADSTPVPPPADTTTPEPEPPPPPSDTTPPAPPPPPTDTTIQIIAQANFDDGTLGPFTNAATPPNTPCNFNGVAGQCSAYQWIVNGKLNILYERHSSLQSKDSNKQVNWAGANIGWGQSLYLEGTWRFPSITPATRQWIDSVAAKAGLAPITADQHLRALRKLDYIERGEVNHAVIHIHDKLLKFTPPVKYDAALGQCVSTGAQVYNLYQFLGTDLLDRDYRVAILYKRSSGVMKPDGELTVWLDGVQIAHLTKVCTNRDSTTMFRNSFGQQYQFDGAYYEMRVLDNLIVGRKP